MKRLTIRNSPRLLLSKDADRCPGHAPLSPFLEGLARRVIRDADWLVGQKPLREDEGEYYGRARRWMQSHLECLTQAWNLTHRPLSLRSPILILLLAILPLAASAAVLIPEARIAALETELAQGIRGRSAVDVRRACKSVTRQASALLEASPGAPNRYAVLAILFNGQKKLLRLESTEKNRAAIFETCRRLMDAPDEYAEIRLEADLLLSEGDLSARGATLGERAEALAAMLERYRGTVVEAKSLMMAALIVQKLDAPELERAIQDAMDERFSDDHEVIEFRRKYLKISWLNLRFKGEFNRIDGVAMSFPADTMGHLSLMLFWSKKPGFETYLEKTKEALTKSSDLVDVFSFNLDELADGGASILKEQGIDWTVMQLPGGRRHEAYRAYANGDPVAVLVNEYGLSVIQPDVAHGPASELNPKSISEPRYMAQLQSLFIGDFLVAERDGDGDERPTTNAQQPTPKLETIQSCFVRPPFRYRLTLEEALANYRKAAKLCAEAIKDKPKEDDISALRDRRIIALLGMWNTACEPRYLEEAVKESKAALAGKPAPGMPRRSKRSAEAGADVVARFCLAKASLREANALGDRVPPTVCVHGKGGAGTPCTLCISGKSPVESFLEACGGDDAPAAALAAAAILALEAGSRERHETYRDRFLAKHGDDPELYAFTSFLRDRHHRYRLLKPNHTRGGARYYIANNGGEPMANQFPKIELKKLDGGTLSLPKDTNGKLTFVLFVEPPPGATNDFPVVLDHNGKPTRNDGVRQVMGYASDLTERHINKDINFVTAFLTDDADHVRFLMKTNGWSCLPAMVPGGLANPMVRQLGILSADHSSNVFLLRRDGTIAWRASGLTYKNVRGFHFALLLGMKVNVEVCDVEYGYDALVAGDFKTAARIFAGPYMPWAPDRFGWRSSRYHGKALAYMGLKDWGAALESIDTAILAHKLRHFRGRRRHGWQQDAASVVMKVPCDILAMQWSTKADILEKLGRSKESASARKQADEPGQPDNPDPYTAFHEKLEKWQQQTKIERP